MKKSIFKVGFLTTLVLILLVSCTSPEQYYDLYGDKFDCIL